MLPFRSIKSLYPLALAEGEGVGTAYEYFAKRLVLTRWLAKLPPAQRLMIAGLPEKYGCSLDFLLVAQEMGVAEVTVIDDRPLALDKIRKSLAAAQDLGELTRVQPHYTLVSEIAHLVELTGGFDLVLGSELLQRLNGEDQRRYVARLAKLAPALALFAPNGDNPSHTNLSGLSGLGLAELQALIGPLGIPAAVGYVDMPPFPPGLTRSTAQRSQAKTGRGEAMAMRTLHQFARLEKHFPLGWRRGHAHIVYALMNCGNSHGH
jgi:hypothetical protein